MLARNNGSIVAREAAAERWAGIVVFLPRSPQLRHHLVREHFQIAGVAGGIDEQDVIDAAGLETLEAGHDVGDIAQQRQILVGKSRIGVGADVLVTFCPWATRECANGL